MARKPPARPPHTDPTTGPLGERPHPQLATALRARVKSILLQWVKEVRQHVPPAREISFDEVRDSLPDILVQMADAFATGHPEDIRKLMERSPSQGIQRFQLHYNTWHLATEDRMLRRIIVDQIGDHLRRRLTVEEDAALHWAIDLMSQQAMVHFVEHQNQQLRIAAEAELKYLSFLSHDLNNNLGNVTLWLQILKSQLVNSPEFAQQVASLNTAQQSILDTMGGMGRLLQAERLRHATKTEPTLTPVDLHSLAGSVAAPFVRQAELKGVALLVEIPANTTIATEPDLIRLVLQNLIGNAVKYSQTGSVRIRAAQDKKSHRWTLSVSDDGPGIPPDHVDRLFEAFQRGEMHGQAGLGLGLAIASRAAKLLGAEISVESKLTKGSTFRLLLPPTK